MWSALGKFVALRTASATIITTLFYLTILIVAEWQDAPRRPPNTVSDVDLSEAFRDLKFVRLNLELMQKLSTLLW